MAKHTSFIVGAALSLGLALPALAQDAEAEAPATETATMDVTAETVVATVNGEEITLGHLMAARLALPQQYQALPNEVLLPGLVEQLIQQTVLSQATAEVSARGQIQIDNEIRAVKATETLGDILAGAVDEDKVQALYAENYVDAEPSVEWNASHILVETEEEAAALIEELNDGADFAALAREHSTGPSGAEGGALDWFGPGMMVEPFEVAVTDMEVGEVAGPLQTQFGWHVVKLNDTREAPVPELEAVRGEIIEALENEAVEAALAEMLEGAEVERIELDKIDPAVLSDPSMFE
ncbi:peptidylprolyl isomerase [Maritimibacter fusiformis]|uniref:Parvulin-like PPIase n=1 Tax=Maritimibacter fusiformis TaxID=2603819 RepID=A0A5D0R8D6_9RHOB|nr:peptidylprolyl isomerase [Maritimibacter fusiformis]TYB77703.1 peptidylprolyl isomerase [Maritimibacter fusiformis]